MTSRLIRIGLLESECFQENIFEVVGKYVVIEFHCVALEINIQGASYVFERYLKRT